MKKFSLLGLVLIIGLFASCTPTVGHICTVFEENKDKRVEATCTENGSKTTVCVECGTEKVETIPALGHNTKGPFKGIFTKIDGSFINTTYYKCSECETVYDTNEPWLIPMKGFEDTPLEYVYNTILVLSNPESIISYDVLRTNYSCLQYGPLYFEDGEYSCTSILDIEGNPVFPPEN